MQLSTRGRQMAGRSGIRSIMEDIAAAGADFRGGEWINLSPGNPSAIPEVVATWQRLSLDAVNARFLESSTRYGPSRGTGRLVEAIVDYFNATYGWSIGPANVLVGPGSQLLAFVATTLFTGPGEDGQHRPLVLPRQPDYTGYHGLGLDAGGVVGVEPRVVPDGERGFRYRLDAEALNRLDRIGMLLVSNPANPTGGTLDAGELRTLIEVATCHDAPLVVDHAYGRPFPGVAAAELPPVLHPQVINLFTLSKAGLPGERIAFAIGPEEFIEPMLSFVANSTLHGPQLMQATVAEALSGGQLDEMVRQHIRPYYLAKRAAAEEMLAETLPDRIDWRLHSSDGGMFCWLHLDHDWFDDLTLYEHLKERGMFIVPGRHFFVAPLDTPFLRTHGTRCFRISLSPEERVVKEGISRLAQALDELEPRSSTRG